MMYLINNCWNEFLGNNYPFLRQGLVCDLTADNQQIIRFAEAGVGEVISGRIIAVTFPWQRLTTFNVSNSLGTLVII